MSHIEGNGETYSIRCSGVIAEAFRMVQRQAEQEQRGEEVLAAIRVMHLRLKHNPLEFGEPLYHLPAVRMQVRSGVIGPLAIHYGVLEDFPIVVINGVRLLSAPPGYGTP